MAINDKYRFIITTPSGQFHATPDVSQLRWQWKKHGTEDFFIKELSSDLRFINSSKLGIFDFDKLHTIERSGQLCERTEITVEKNCGDGSWTLFYQGYMAMVDGEWDEDRCTVEIKPRTLDSLACLIDHWKSERNLVNYADFRTISRIEGEIEEKQCCGDNTGHPWDHINSQSHRVTYDVVVDCLTGSGWNVMRNEMSFRIYGRIFDPLRGEWKICTTWIREKWNGGGVPTSPGWSQDGGDYVRPIPTILVDQIDNLEDLDVNNLEDALFWQQYERLPDLEYGLSLKEIIVGMINQRCTFDIVSNFLGINPDGSNPTNLAYEYAIDYLQELMVFDVNAFRNNITQGPTILAYDFEEIWKDLRTMFNITMRIKEGKLYIEHVSYFQDQFMLDLTTEDRVHHLSGKRKYTYAEEELPRYEKWEYGHEPDGYFRSLQVEYKGDCVRAEEEKTDTYPVQNFVVDVDGIFLSNMIEQDTTYSDQLLVLVATKDGVVNRYPITPLGGEIVTNGVMTWPNLFENLHRWGRKKRTGLVQRYVDDPGVSTEFFSRIYNRRQKDIRIPMCCSDLDQFAPEDYVRTQLGWGKVEDASYEEPAGILNLNLLHD